MSSLSQLRTYARLGPASILRVAAYRLGLKSGFHPVQSLQAPIAKPPFFRESERKGEVRSPNSNWDDHLWWFGWFKKALPDEPPDWLNNQFTDTAPPDVSDNWWQIKDFDTGDIKGLWELSRFDWVVA